MCSVTSISWRITKTLRQFNPKRLLIKSIRIVANWACRNTTIVYKIKPLLKRYPRLWSMLRRLVLCNSSRKTSIYDDFLSIPLGNIKFLFCNGPLADTRGIGRVSHELLKILQSYSEAHKQRDGSGIPVYFYPSIHWCPESLSQPSIVMIHDVIPLLFPELFPDEQDEWAIRYKSIAQQASKIVTISESSATDISRIMKIPREKISVIYNGVSTLPVAIEDLPPLPDFPYIVYLGSFDKHKNVGVILQAMQDPDLQELELIMIGDNNDLYKQVEKMELQKRVHFLGRLDDAQVGYSIKNSLALVFPSLYEGFGLPPLEAALLGVPSICSKRPAMTEILEGASIFIEPNDPVAWAAAISELIINPCYRQEIADNSTELAKKFTWENSCTSFLNVLNEISNGENLSPKFDEYWVSTISFIKSIVHPDGNALVPNEMLTSITDSKPCGWSFFANQDEFDIVVIHKGRVEEISRGFLDEVSKNMHYAYGNVVFNVYSKSNKTSGEDCYYLNLEKIVSLARQTGRNAGSTRSRNILLVTANQFGNLGDDAITHAARIMLNKVYPDAKLTIAAPPVERSLIDNTDILVIGGGGLFYDACIDNLTNYTSYIFYAREAGKRCFCIGIGTQGIKTKTGCRFYKEALARVEYTLVRDLDDARVLIEEVGVTTPVIATQDLVFSLPEPANATFSSVSARKTVLFCLTSSDLLASKHRQKYQKVVIESVKALSEDYDIKYMVQSRDDLSFYKMLIEKTSGEIIEVPFEEAITAENRYTGADLVVTSRFHGLIFAIKAGVPVIPMGSHGLKIDRLISHYIPSLSKAFIPIKQLSKDIFVERLNMLKFSGRSQFIAKESERQKCIELSLKTVDLMLDFERNK